MMLGNTGKLISLIIAIFKKKIYDLFWFIKKTKTKQQKNRMKKKKMNKCMGVIFWYQSCLQQ